MARQFGVEFFLMLVIGLVLGLFGPFGTFAMAPAIRIAFWMVYILLGYAIFRPMIVLGKWMSEAFAIPRIIGVGLALLIASAPLTFMIALLFTDFDAGRALRSDGLPALYFDVWLVGFLINAFVSLAVPKRESEASVAIQPLVAAPLPEAPVSPMLAPSPLPPPALVFADRLPPGFGAVHALKGEDHYVRVIGEGKEALILIRLRDAIAELGAAEGMQVHRSWWVARDGVLDARRDGRALTLLLGGGIEVPVSRDKAAALKTSGWPVARRLF